MSERPRFPLFDSLRGIAAISVLTIHVLDTSKFLAAGGPLAQVGARLDVGVTIFFLISGFLLYRPFAEAHVGGQRRPATGPYAWRRALRIVPAYWVALTVFVIVFGVAGVFTARGIPIYYGFGQIYSRIDSFGGLPPAWTLCVEVSFYAFLPLYALALRLVRASTLQGRLRAEWVGIAALIAVSTVWQLVLTAGAENPEQANTTFGLLFLPAFLDHFALGMAAAVLSVSISAGGSLPRALRPIDRVPSLGAALSLGALLVVSFGVGLDGVEGLEEPVTAVQYFARHWSFALVALGLLIPVAFGDPRRGRLRALLARRELLYLGSISYGIYLWHFVFVRALDELDDGRVLGGPIPTSVSWWLVCFAATVVAATLSFRVIERPIMSLRSLVPVRARQPAAREAEAQTASGFASGEGSPRP